MRRRWYVGALAACALVAAAAPTGGARSTAEPTSLAERIDLTRITVLQADYARAQKERDERDLAAFDRELATMLQDEILPYARDDAPSGAAAGGTGSAAGASDPQPEGRSAVAGDEAEVGAAALDARVADLAREFISLEGKLDPDSVARKSTLIGTLQAISARAQFPGTPPSTEQTREARQRAAKERRERQQIEDLPAK
jgi:hypothetical protein